MINVTMHPGNPRQRMALSDEAMTAPDAHETLQELLAERAAVVAGPVTLEHLGELDDLDVMIQDARSAWVGAAVTEIASLRGMLSGPQQG